MNHLGTRKLETERLILRKFVLTDAEAMYRNWASRSEVTKFLTWPTHESVEESKQVIESWVNSYQDVHSYQWAIELKSIGEPIGTISIVRCEESLSEVEIGYCIGETWWHQGIISEAFTEIIRFLFEEVGVNRIAARHDVNNPHSGGVMKKCGLRYEGTMREAAENNQGICDICNYAILKSDYETRKE